MRALWSWTSYSLLECTLLCLTEATLVVHGYFCIYVFRNCVGWALLWLSEVVKSLFTSIYFLKIFHFFFFVLSPFTTANAELIYRVLMLQETVGRALKISQEAAARMEELQIQLSVLQRQCTYRDRPLCDTLRIRSFEENGIIDALKTVG